MKTTILLLFISFLNFQTNAQDWLRDIQNPNANFFTVQKEFNEWEKTQPTTGISEQYEGISELYYRWANYWQTRLNSDGTLRDPYLTIAAKEKYLSENVTTRSGTYSGDWQPVDYTIAANPDHIGRVDCIALSPTDSNTIWVGCPTGGLWKTTNGGNSWTTNTDALPEIGISDIVIDPTNEANMYIAVGDRDIPQTDGMWSIGVYKSTDTGKTWNQTGLNWPLVVSGSNNLNVIKRLIMDPSNPNTLYAAVYFLNGNNSNFGYEVYKTTNGGSTWTTILTEYSSQFEVGGPVDIALMPGNSSTLYIAFVNESDVVQVTTSTDGGSTFSTPVTLSQTSDIYHVRLAVTPAAPDNLYVVSAGFYDFNSFYLSQDKGNTFTLQCDSPNILGYDCDNNPSFNSGQGYYDLTLNVSPTNANEVLVGGISVFQSQNAGVTWNLTGCWTTNIHADQHYTLFSPYHNDVIFEGNDGGIFKSPDLGNTWIPINANIRSTQYYGVDVSPINKDRYVAGCQDNGTELYSHDSLSLVGQGDGGNNTFFDYANDHIYFYMVNQSPMLYINDNDEGVKGYFQINPQNSKSWCLYDTGLYKSFDNGNTWNKIQPSANPVSGYTDGVIGVNFTGADSNTLFVTPFSIVSATNGNVTTIPNSSITSQGGIPEAYCVSNTDTNKIWVVLNEYSGDVVYYTSDGGGTWTNITGSLPGVSFHSIIYQKNSTDDAVYLATDAGVFYWNNSLTDWQYWSTGLPNTNVTQLKIDYLQNELVASTYGRGLWESPLTEGAGINQLSVNNDQLSVYPNPNNGLFTIKLQGINQNAQLQIFNVLGQNIYQANINSTTTQLNLSNKPKGMYLYRVSTSNGQLISNGKIVIE